MVNNQELAARIHVGTYQVYGAEQMEDRVRLAKEVGLYQFDTARLYRNEKVLARVLEEAHYPQRPRITTKLYKELFPHEIAASAAKSVSHLGGYVDRLLLHRPTSVAIWQALESVYQNDKGATIGAIGVR